MGIKCILAPLSGGAVDGVVARAAIVIAKRFDSEIQVIFPRDSAAIAAGALIGDERDEATERFFDLLRESDEAAEDQVRGTFQTILRELNQGGDGAATALLDVTDDGPVQAIIERGGAHDLLIVALPDADSGDQGKARAIAEGALFHTGRQVLLVSNDISAGIGTKVMICWNKSPQAGRAVAQAMPFLTAAEDVSIFYVETGAKRGPSPGRLKHYLGLHGIQASITQVPPDYRAVGEQILDEAQKWGANLLVMGAYSRSRLSERLLGGVTSYIFANSDVPVLMTR
jgi:nucleotide-binding universal stress UspA family protein